jgi:hypothetical protein
MKSKTVFSTVVAIAVAFSFKARAQALLTTDEAAQQMDAIIAAVKRDKQFDAWIDCVSDRADDSVSTLRPKLVIKVALHDCLNREMAVLAFMIAPPLSIKVARASEIIASTRAEMQVKLLKLLEKSHTQPASARSPSTSSTLPPNSLAWLMARPWYHVEGPVTDAQFERDKNKCALVAQQAPVEAGTPWVKYVAVFTTCLRAEGYEPEPESKSGTAAAHAPGRPITLAPSSQPLRW